MDREYVLAQLGAIRAICDAFGAAVVAEGQPAPAGGCDHPESMRENASTMGGPRQFYCRACKAIVTE